MMVPDLRYMWVLSIVVGIGFEKLTYFLVK